MLIVSIAAALVLIFDAEVIGVVAFVLLLSALLVICDDLMTLLLPLLLLCISVLQCYNSFNTFIKLAYLAVIPIGALAFNLIYYRRPQRHGQTFTGLVAVATAVTLGGLFTIPVEEYFNPIALYYVVMLGFGMVAVYLIIKSRSGGRADYNVGEKFTEIMFTVGLFACFHIFELYLECMTQSGEVWWASRDYGFTPERLFPNGMTVSDIVREFTEGGLFRFNTDYFCRRLQPGNNISTFILIAMPYPVYLAVKRNKLFLLAVPLNVLALLMTKSRGGIIMGAIELLICLLIPVFYEKRKAWRVIFITVAGLYAAAGTVLFFALSVPQALIALLTEQTDTRAQLIVRSLEDFCAAPIFGRGLGSFSNSDIYNGVKGTLPWYHMMTPQVIGSMGLLGIVCYAYQFIERLSLVIRRRNAYVVTLGASYAGLLLMSQVNPGEFCPIPYGMIAVITFIMIEESEGKQLLCQERKEAADQNTCC